MYVLKKSLCDNHNKEWLEISSLLHQEKAVYNCTFTGNEEQHKDVFNSVFATKRR